jgi:nicotinamidase-related amidase
MTLLNRDQCGLLVIDMQTGFYGPKRSDVDRTQFDRVAARIAWLVELAAVINVPVVVTEEESDHNGHTVEQIRKVLPDDAATLPKDAFSAWDNDTIASALEATGKDTFVLVGIETDVCVAHSALQLQTTGKRVAVVSDATYSPGAAHQAGLARLASSPVELLSAKEVYYDWLRSVTQTVALRDTHPQLFPPPAGIVL